MSYLDSTGNVASQPPGSTITSDVGRIVMWPTATPPPGYLLCDGSLIPAQYGELIAVVGTNTPDLRGKFLRSSGSHAVGTTLPSGTAQPAKGKPSASAAGQHSHSITAVGNHTHGGQYGLNASGSGAEVLRAGPNDGIAGNWSGFGKIRPGGSHSHLLNGNGGHTHTLTGYDPETVPNNVRLVYVIKAA